MSNGQTYALKIKRNQLVRLVVLSQRLKLRFTIHGATQSKLPSSIQTISLRSLVKTCYLYGLARVLTACWQWCSSKLLSALSRMWHQWIWRSLYSQLLEPFGQGRTVILAQL